MSWYTGLEHIVREGEPLAPLTWFRLGGNAEFFAEPTSVEELADLLKRASEQNLQTRFLGGGSRVLVSDAGVNGLVIQLSAPAFCESNIEGQTISVGGGVKLSHLVSMSVREGLGGLESLVGIPGTVAGALKGNADSNGTSIGQWTEEVTVMKRDGKTQVITRDELRFSYRQGNLDDPAILAAKFKLEPADSTELTRRMQMLWIVKKGSQPSSGIPQGRIFLDSKGMLAADLIEQSGLRNQSVGKAEVSDQNANFIVANADATSEDVTRLIEVLQEQVQAQLDVKLEKEIQIW